MTDQDRQTTQGGAIFTWHPELRGRRLEDVKRDLESEIARDQRAYELALSGAEESEHDALASVVDVDRRWSTYHFGWNEADPSEVAERVASLEWEREQRQDMISWQAYRNAGQSSGAPRTSGASSGAGGDWRASMDDTQRRKAANILAGIIMALIVVAMIAVVVLVL